MCVGSCPKSKLSAVCLSSALAAGNLPVDQLATPDRTQDCLEKHYLRVGWLGNRVFRSPHTVGPEQLRDDLRDLRCASADQRAACASFVAARRRGLNMRSSTLLAAVVAIALPPLTLAEEWSFREYMLGDWDMERHGKDGVRQAPRLFCAKI